MEVQAVPKRIYRFGLFEADPESGKLLREGIRVKLQDQPFRLLCLLLDRAGQVVTREELRQSLWSNTTFVEFDGSLNAALARLRSALGDSSENPIFVETLPKRGYRFLAPVALRESPAHTLPAEEEKPHSASAVEEQLTTEDGLSSSHVEPESAAWRRRLIFGGALALLVGLGVASYHRLTSAVESRSAPPLAAQPVKPRVSVAVIGFNNLSGRAEDAWLSTALSEMLSTELASGDKLRLVPGEDIAHLRMLSPWMQAGTLGQSTSSRIGLSLGSDVLVLGSYASIAKGGKRRVRVDVRMQDAAKGNVLIEVAETESEENVFHLASVVGSRLRQKLGLPADSPSEQAGELASMPSNPEAARLYALGLEKLREFDAQTASDLFEQAIKADPKFPLAHSMLAGAWGQLGYEQKRKDEAKTALSLSANLPRSDRMLIEADYYESQANHEKAASTYRALFALFPDNVEYGLRLINAQTASAHVDQAMETIRLLRGLPPPASNDPRIDLAEAHGNPNKAVALGLIRAALRKSETQGEKLTYAQARKEECMALVYGDHPEQALPVCDDAHKSFLAAGNRLASADITRLIGDSEGAAGRYGQAIATYQRALQVLKQLGEHAKTGTVLNNMAVDFTNEGKLDRAEDLYRQAKYHFEQIGDKRNTAVALGNMADILYLRGDLPGATRLYQDSLEIEAALVPSQPGYGLYRLADLELAEGKPREAREHAQQAVESMRADEGGYQYLTGAMVVLGDVLMAQADLTGARQQYEQALDLRKKIGAQDLVAESQVSLARLSVEEGHPDQAEPLLRDAIIQFEKENAIPDEAEAQVELGRALRVQGKLEDSVQSLARAQELGRSNPDPAFKLLIANENVRAGTARVASPGGWQRRDLIARRQLESAILSARKLGYYKLECEARLALVEVNHRANIPTTGKQAAALKLETDKKGLLLLSRKAALLGQ